MSSLEHRCPPRQPSSTLNPHSYDKSIAAVRLHPDLTLATRAVHAACVSLHNMGKLGQVTQQEIADHAGVGLRSVVRAMKQLVAAKFIAVKRRGQGKPNAYELIGPGSAKRAQLATPYGRNAPSWSEPRRKNPGRNIDPGTDPASWYDVAASLARERATYQEASARYGRYAGR